MATSVSVKDGMRVRVMGTVNVKERLSVTVAEAVRDLTAVGESLGDAVARVTVLNCDRVVELDRVFSPREALAVSVCVGPVLERLHVRMLDAVRVGLALRVGADDLDIVAELPDTVWECTCVRDMGMLWVLLTLAVSVAVRFRVADGVGVTDSVKVEGGVKVWLGVSTSVRDFVSVTETLSVSDWDAVSG